MVGGGMVLFMEQDCRMCVCACLQACARVRACEEVEL